MTEDEQLLAELLAAWDDTRDVALEPAIDRVGARASLARPDLVYESKPAEIEARWLALARAHDPADVHRLLARPWPSPWPGALRRVEALAGFAPDPRIARTLAAHAMKHFTEGAMRVHVAVIAILEAAASPSLSASIDVVLGLDNAALTRQYVAVQRAIAVRTVRRAPAELVARASGNAQLDALWAAHVADPSDLAHRTVLADVLQAEGDPRGELIALQLAGSPDRESAKRARALIDLHGDAWTAALPGVVRGSRRFERGFLVAARTTANVEALVRSAAHPEWVTLEELTLDSDRERVDLGPLLARMPRLRRLAAPTDTLDAISGHHPSIETLVHTRVPPPGAWTVDRARFPSVAIVAEVSSGLVVTRQASAVAGGYVPVYFGITPSHLAAIIATPRDAAPAETRFMFQAVPVGATAIGWCARLRGDAVELCWCSHHHGRFTTLPELAGMFANAGVVRIAVAEVVTSDLRTKMHSRGVAIAECASFDVLSAGVD